ncbi:MAG: GTP cyclohydrolase II [Alphaproteobacteria bacterium]|nr:GTP cyclohydrolase II [Alphaproteobacteria bacterium]
MQRFEKLRGKKRKKMTFLKNYDPVSLPRFVDELRRGMPIRFTDGDAFRLFPAEHMGDTLPAAGELRLLITGARARSMGHDTTDDAVRMDVTGLEPAYIRALFDPLADSTPPALPVQAASPAERLLLALAKLASLMPALLMAPDAGAPDMPALSYETLQSYFSRMDGAAVETARARLPIAGAEDTRIISYRMKDGVSTHLALLIGSPETSENPMVRLHSSCVTGDILESLRCDCGSQLRDAVSVMASQGGGILLYLHQEGRGIGLTNKLRAYALQERGFDTYTANLMLGFDEDERDFTLAASILKKLGVSRIRLLTNNPRKIEALTSCGIEVSERIPLAIRPGAHNQAYLDAKANKSGHLF